ncbi:ExbD/TolR family protein [Agaribacterium haliotis]|uniref:ExbD/TolR family protein n=1 Tax=Agaribacterium haliotis TaxID=2013869 RepID=UPI000BB536D8|nr:biopolymer transporter ExbD [Agaribacterium haliotis]
MKFKRQVTAEEGVNLTPLIDVVFLLLIFFMVSTTFTKESHLEIDLPEASADKRQQQTKEIEVVIDQQGNYTVNGRVLVDNNIETLQAAVVDVADGDNQLPFIITGDADASYQSIVAVMDLAGQLGFVNLSMTTRSPESASP